MASPLQQALTSLQTNNYVFVVITTVVGYDYILTFSREIEYVWNKRWTFVSTLYVLTRYFGLLHVISTSIFGTAFLPGPAKVLCRYPHRFLMAIDTLCKWLDVNRCEASVVLTLWSFWIYIFAAEVVMILRVWALYNQSRIVLGFLLALFAMEMISGLIYYVDLEVQWGSNNGMGYGTTQVLQFSVCFTESFGPTWLSDLPAALQVVVGASICLLTAIRFIKELLRVYRATRGFKLNHYMKCLAKDGIIYFLVILVSALAYMLYNTGPLTPWAVWRGAVLQNTAPFTLVPRFILGLRELYTRDTRGRREGFSDTAFGLGSGLGHSTVQSAIAFADPKENQEDEQNDEIQMEIQEGHSGSSRA